MIIWRSWGILGLLVPAGVVGLFMALGAALGMTGDSPDLTGYFLLLGLGLLAAGAAVYFLGIWFNRTRPEEKLQDYVGQRRMELEHLVRGGSFHLGPGYPPPASMVEAQQQAAFLLEKEEAELRTRMYNHHTLFFIPMQWIGPVIGLGGLVALGYAFVA